MNTITVEMNGREAQMAVKPFFSHERTIIAIDPDTDKSGIATVVSGKLLSLDTMDFFEILDAAKVWKEKGVLVLLEHVDNSRGMYARKGAKNAGIKASIAQKVGRVKHAAGQITQVLERAGVEFLLVPPLVLPEKKRAKKGTGAAEFFNALTGWQGRTSEDKRDAALIALYGLPNDYSACDKRHVVTGNFCKVCKEEEMQRARRSARAKAARRTTTRTGG